MPSVERLFYDSFDLVHLAFYVVRMRQK